MRKKWRPCLQCETKTARFPKDDPIFCTQKCAVTWAIWIVRGDTECAMIFCEIHRRWFNPIEYSGNCFDCMQEKNEEEEKRDDKEIHDHNRGRGGAA